MVFAYGFVYEFVCGGWEVGGCCEVVVEDYLSWSCRSSEEVDREEWCT